MSTGFGGADVHVCAGHPGPAVEAFSNGGRGRPGSRPQTRGSALQLLPTAAAVFVVLAAALAALFPVALSVGAVFLFAGPHNWLEARYFASRMPVRWGKQRGFFLTALAGVIGLSATFSFVPVDRSFWHAALVGWALLLVRMVRPEALLALAPAALAWAAFALLAPVYADLTLVYLHPLAALWFVRRQIVKSRPQWSPQFRVIALALPLLAIFVVSARAGQPVTSAVQFQSFVPLANSPALLALHAFLELLHYGAWVMLLPAIGLASAPWDLRAIPLIRHRLGWPKLVSGSLLIGAALVALLWILFALDFETTRRVYFSIAIIHVLAEVPLLAWLR